MYKFQMLEVYCELLRVVNNCGSAAGASWRHSHVHIGVLSASITALNVLKVEEEHESAGVFK